MIRRKAIATYLLVFLSIIAVGAWVVFRLFFCWGKAYTTFWKEQLLCHFELPAAFLLLIGFAFVCLMLADVHALGDEMEISTGSRPVRMLRRVSSGYRNIERSHQKHVMISSIWFLLALIGLVLLLVFGPFNLHYFE